MTRAAFLRGRLPGLKKLVAAGPGGGLFLGAAANWGGCLAGGLDSGVAWPRVVSQRLLSGCWPWAARGMLGLGAAQKVWQLQQHAIVREGWAPNSRFRGSSPTAWSSSSGGAAARNTPSLACWSRGSAVRAAALKAPCRRAFLPHPALCS